MNKSLSTFSVLLAAFLLGAAAQASHIIDVSNMISKKPEVASAKAAPVLHTVGETVAMNNYKITANNAFFDNGNMAVDFTVDNIGLDTINIYTTGEFSVRDMDGNKLEQVYCGKYFGGKVVAGDKLRGRICWSNADPSKNLKVYYKPTNTVELVLWRIY